MESEQPVTQVVLPEESQTPTKQDQTDAVNQSSPNKSTTTDNQSVTSELSEKAKAEQETLRELMWRQQRAVRDRNYLAADRYQNEIEIVNARIIRENIEQYCYMLRDALDPVYKANMQKIKKFRKQCFQQELALRTEISSKFQNTQQLHLACLKQFDESQFQTYSRILINSENVKYNRAIDKARKLANEGKFDEADMVAKEAIAENGKLFGQREADFTAVYKQKVKQLLDEQTKDFTTLLNSSNKTLEELTVTRERMAETLYKSMKSDLDRVFAKHLEKLNKHFANFSNPHMEPPRVILNEYYHNYLANKSIIEPPVMTITQEKQLKQEAERMRQEKRALRELEKQKAAEEAALAAENQESQENAENPESPEKQENPETQENQEKPPEPESSPAPETPAPQ
ncbi:hypothetical protein TVAG_045610 [Trichomonas vaginalis G3]|uniref:Uncharacterized protein n=1 Tax=Trichomonas vaginalis (strain ATCC PRA-98 / G3) TaxID=412133 RepID=A2DMD2_TRIV3|nr:hypothetical protein TVAGG3_0604840 [Trichomonas vaginalis G3]EAY18359.1 hypothetical protein TVAG_045610 [Trichomonas vaginalis G3]KAI5524176.1 hypothetical protein TVAGG3_0604840 [Trichomonas vaginalis G3]|eukprot:XP_001579345.1 hypothetical protein [Trichomonas vaginalis G3]